MKRPTLAVTCLAVVSCAGGFSHAANAQSGMGSGDVAPSTSVDTPGDLIAKSHQLQRRLDILDLQHYRTQQINAYPGLLPGTGVSIPSGFGAFSGEGGIGVGYQAQTRPSVPGGKKGSSDGTAGILLGFGNAQKGTGFEATFNVLDLGPFADRGSFSFKLHHRIDENSSVAVGVEDVLGYGHISKVDRNYSDSPKTTYVVYSRTSDIGDGTRHNFSHLYSTIGAGNGRFQEVSDIGKKNSFQPFGGVATNLSDNANVFTEWTGQDLNVGISIIPFKRLPLVVTPAFVDLTHHAGDSARFTVGVGYSFTY